MTPEFILSSILKRAIHPDALHHALAISLVDPEEYVELAEDELHWQFLDNYFQRDSTLFKFPTTMYGIITLAYTHNMVSRFVDDYICHTLHALYAIEETQQDSHRPAGPCSSHAACQAGLSATEKGRIQRAFFRYEVYSRCFPVSPRLPDESIFPSNDQFNHFLQQMAPWEVEELTCVHEYLWVRASRIFSEVEEEVVVKVLDAQTATASAIKKAQMGQAESHRQPKSNSSKVDDGLCRFKTSNVPGLELFSEDDRSALPDVLRYIVSLGLHFLQSFLFFAKGQRKRDLIRNNYYYGERDFLPQAISQDPNPSQIPNNPENISDNDISHVNLGYLLYKPSSVEAILSAMGIAEYWPLRRLGYVFWDIERVRDPEISERLRDARDCDPNEAKKMFEEFIQESAETRLKGIKLPRTLLEEIQNDYALMYNEPILETDSESEILDSEEDSE